MSSASRIYAAALAALLAAGFAGADEPGATLRALVEQAAVAAARGQVEPPDRFEPLAVRFTGSDHVPQGSTQLELAEARGPNASGIVELRFRVLVDGTPRGEARASVRGTVRGPVLIAAQPLPAGRPIDPRAVETGEGELTRLGGEPLRDRAQLAGRAPARTLGPGRVVSAELLRATPVVRQGDLVDLRLVRAGFTVTVKGRVKRDGAPGETVPAENAATGTQLIARVQQDGSLLVLRSAAAARLR